MLNSTIREQIKKYASAYCFRKATQWHIRNAWHRPLDCGENQIDQIQALNGLSDVATQNGYLLNKILYTIYEQAGIFLPHMRINPICRKDYDAYFDRGLIGLGLALRINLEDAIFGFLEPSIEIREWTGPSIVDYMKMAVADEDRSRVGLVDLLSRIKYKKAAIQLYLLHKSSDFLTEGSAMTGSLGGSYGPLQSSLMRIFMDEYGNGLLERKHSSLFRRAMASCGLESYPHCYFEDYLPSSLMMANYFHFLCKTPKHFFQYLGAMYYAEATTTCFFQKLRGCFMEALGASALDLSYFEEHIEVDQCHRDIVLNELIVPAIETYGGSILQDLYVGFESFRRLAACAAVDLSQQIAFADSIFGEQLAPEPQGSSPTLLHLASGNRAFFPQVASPTLNLVIESGTLEFGVGTGEFVTLNKGRRVVIPQGRLFRMRSVQGQDCNLAIYDH